MTTGILALKLYSYWDMRKEADKALQQAMQPPQFVTLEDIIRNAGRGGPGATPGTKSGGGYNPYTQGPGGGFPPGHPGGGGQGGDSFLPPGRYA